ncbi:DUF1007 family protein [Gemmobacter denitrificans]|uniref:DUF1007 family protein n=1 Tax=Gemmobacter denitrificans TaxID=3123040 RepID=A0ABU8BSC6_9RHOB
MIGFNRVTGAGSRHAFSTHYPIISSNCEKNLRSVFAACLLALPFCAALTAQSAQAHPHVWVDAGIEVIFDADGRASALRIRWTYDEFYSLVLVEERGQDADHDGTATAAENAALSGFDMNWHADFAGDTYLLAGGQPVALSRPESWTADYRDGRLTSTHVRRIDPPLDPLQGLQVQVYDPGFYTAYTIAFAPVFTPALPKGCSAQVLEPDRSAADQQLLDALAEYGADENLEADFPAIGASFSEEVKITCAP